MVAGRESFGGRLFERPRALSSERRLTHVLFSNRNPQGAPEQAFVEATRLETVYTAAVGSWQQELRNWMLDA